MLVNIRFARYGAFRLFLVLLFLAFTTAPYCAAQGISFPSLRKSSSVSANAAVFNVGSNSDSDSDVAELTPGNFPTSTGLMASAGFMGASSTANLTLNASLSDEGDGMWQGGVTGTSEAVGVSGAEGFAQTQSGGGVTYTFEFDEGEVHLTATGSLSSSSTRSSPGGAQGRFRLYQPGSDDIVNIRSHSPPAPDFDLLEQASVNVDMMLPPGRYVMNIGGSTIANTGSEDPSITSTSDFSVSFSLNHTGVQSSDTYFWEALDGTFDDETRWEPEGVPGNGDTAIFDRDQQYFVAFGDQSSSRALIERGDVAWAGGSYTLEGGDANNASLVVGNDSNDTANLSIIGGHELDTNYTIIAKGTGTEAEVALAPDGLAADWTNYTSLVVADHGTGELSVGDNGRLSTIELIIGREADSLGAVVAQSNGTSSSPSLASSATAVGHSGIGELIVQDDSVLTVGLVFGLNATGRGFGRLSSAAKGLEAALWEAGRVTIGDEGFGSLTVNAGSTFDAFGMEDNVIGNAAGSAGEAIVTGCDALMQAFNLTVGHNGQGFVEITNGGQLEVDVLAIGFDSSGEGDVMVSGSCTSETPSVLTMPMDGDSFIGGQGTGVLRILDGASSTMGNVAVGALAGGVGLAVVNDAEWFIDDRLALGDALPEDEVPPATGSVVLQNNGYITCGSIAVLPGSGIYGNGTLELPAGPNNLVQGTISSGVWIQPAPAKGTKGAPLIQRTRGHGTLNIIGNISVEGGMLDLSVGGMGDGQFDRIVVKGDLNLANTTVLINYTDAYGPQIGDKTQVVTATGNLTTNNLTLQYAGLEDGFDYQANNDNGALEIEALTDGIALSPPPTDLNLDGAVDAVDIQLAINGALGLLPAVQTDVNFDNLADAIDVQLVINAALAL